MNDPELILNPVSNRYVKRTSQCGKRLAKVLQTPAIAIPTHLTQPTPKAQETPQPIATPIQTSISSACAEIVASQPQAFRNLSDVEMDSLFKRMLLEKLGVKETKVKPKKIEKKVEKKKKKFKIVSSDSESDSDSD